MAGAALLLLAGSAWRPLAAQRVPEPEVVELSFEGNRAFGAAELRTAIATQETRCRSFLFRILPICPLTNWGFAHDRGYLDEEELPADLLRLRVFYRQRGYRSVRVDTAVTRFDHRVRVKFLIEEGEPVLVDSLRIEVADGVLDGRRLLRDLRLRRGDPFNRLELDAGKQLIRDRLENLGYIHGTVLEDTRIPPGGGARITLEVWPGPRVRVGTIHVRGAGRVGEKVIRQFLTFREGEYFDQRKVLQSQRNLYALRALRFASIARAGELAPDDTVADVVVEVTEAPTRSVRVGGGASTTECALAEARFTHRNFTGGARRLELSGRLSNVFARQVGGTFPCTDVGQADAFRRPAFRLRAEFEQPYFLSPRNGFRAALFQERESFPDVFVRTSSGIELALTRRLRPRMPVALSYRFEYTGFGKESADVFFCVNFGFCKPEDIAVLTERRLLSPLLLSWRYDRTDVPFSPTRGYYAAVEVERADRFTASDYQYLRIAAEAAEFQELAEGLVLGARLRLGVLEPTGGLAFEADRGRAAAVVHPWKRFFAGGPQSVRGFGQNLLGPTVLAVDSAAQCGERSLAACVEELALRSPRKLDERPVGGNAVFEASAELRRGLGGPWGFAAFLDLGQVWEEIEKPEAPILTPGVGIRYRSPVGPLRLDVGYNPTGTRRLPVVALIDGEIRELEMRVDFDPFTYDDPGPLTELFRRLQFHLTIGEAF